MVKRPQINSRIIDVILDVSFCGYLLILGFLLGFKKIWTYDFWWQLKMGEWIWASGTIPKTDFFSFTAEGSRYIDIHWLFQLVIYWIHRAFDIKGLIIFKIFIVLLIILLLSVIEFRKERMAVTAAGVTLGMLLVSDRLMLRPELPSFLFLAAELAILYHFSRTRNGYLYLIVPIQLLWSNVHGLFATGIAVLLIFFAAEIITPFVAPKTCLDRKRAGTLFAVIVLSVLVSFINPNGLDGTLYPLYQFRMIESGENRNFFGMVIRELIPLFDKSSPIQPFFMFYLLTVSGLSVLALALNWRRLQVVDILIWTAFFYLMISARRNLTLFGMVVVPILVRNVNLFLDRHLPSLRRLRVSGAVVLVLLALVIIDLGHGGFLGRRASNPLTGFGIVETQYPVRAIDWIQTERPPGPVFHYLEDGGYLLWRLFPDYRSMIDGRLEVYGVQKARRLITNKPDGFVRLDNKYEFGTVLLHHRLVPSVDLIRWLRSNPAWRLVFKDDVAMIFVREGIETRWPKLDLRPDRLYHIR